MAETGISYILLPAILHINKYMWLMFCLFLSFYSFLYFDFLPRLRATKQLSVYTHHSLRKHVLEDIVDKTRHMKAAKGKT
jgi:hypothetical protein